MPSLGKARPTHGACHSWFGYHLADGRIDDVTVADLNVVEVYAGYVRRKIDTPFGRNALQTVRGAGYRLAADGG